MVDLPMAMVQRIKIIIIYVGDHELSLHEAEFCATATQQTSRPKRGQASKIPNRMQVLSKAG